MILPPRLLVCPILFINELPSRGLRRGEGRRRRHCHWPTKMWTGGPTLLCGSLSYHVVVLGRDVRDHVCDVVREECREL